MASTIFQGNAQSAVIPQVAFTGARLTVVRDKFVIQYDNAVQRYALWGPFKLPQGATGSYDLLIEYASDSDTSNTFRIEAAIEANTAGDSFDQDAGDSYDTANAATTATLPGTAGIVASTTITLTTNDSMAAGDSVMIRVMRDGGHANDSATGKMNLYTIELRGA